MYLQLKFSRKAAPLSPPHASVFFARPQILGYDIQGSQNGFSSSRYLFTDTSGGQHATPGRFVAIDYRGGVGEEKGVDEQLSSQGPWWSLGTRSDGNGVLGIGEVVELSR